MKLLLVSAVIFCACAFAQEPLPTMTLTIGGKQVTAEVASSPETRQHGLMMRKSLAENSGMIFTHDDERVICMWMKDTLIPLSVAFIDFDGTIVNIRDMEPNTLDFHCSAGPVRYALEMDAGWFTANDVKSGDKVEGLPEIIQ